MEILGYIILAFFVALLLFVAATFGVALLTFCIVTAALTAVFVLAREAWRRWRFVHNAQSMENAPPKIIEGEYEDVSHRNDNRRDV